MGKEKPVLEGWLLKKKRKKLQGQGIHSAPEPAFQLLMEMPSQASPSDTSSSPRMASCPTPSSRGPGSGTAST